MARPGLQPVPPAMMPIGLVVLPDFKKALTIAWLVVSALVLPVVLAPFVLSDSVIARWTPVCETKLGGAPPCSLCGMTTAFLLISDINYDEARRANRGALWLYSTLVFNEVFALLFLRSISKGGF